VRSTVPRSTRAQRRPEKARGAWFEPAWLQHYPTFFAFYVGESDDLFRGENE